MNIDDFQELLSQIFCILRILPPRNFGLKAKKNNRVDKMTSITHNLDAMIIDNFYPPLLTVRMWRKYVALRLLGPYKYL